MSKLLSLHLSRLFLFIAAATMCTSCTMEEGQAFNVEYSSQIVVGATTKDVILTNLGNPPSKYQGPEGQETWTYWHSEGTGSPFGSGEGAGEQLVITFSGDKVASCMVSRSSSNIQLLSNAKSTSDTHPCGSK